MGDGYKESKKIAFLTYSCYAKCYLQNAEQDNPFFWQQPNVLLNGFQRGGVGSQNRRRPFETLDGPGRLMIKA